jgi:hypothetical protein
MKYFDRFSASAFIILLVSPLIYLLFPKQFSSYFDALDEVSIPIWAALYSYLWLHYTERVKRNERRVEIEEKRTSHLAEMRDKEYKPSLLKRSELKRDLENTKLNLDFINKALMMSVIVIAATKIAKFVFSIVSHID